MALEELRYSFLASLVGLLGDKRRERRTLGSGQCPQLATPTESVFCIT